MTSLNYPNYSIIKIAKNTEKFPGTWKDFLFLRLQ